MQPAIDDKKTPRYDDLKLAMMHEEWEQVRHLLIAFTTYHPQYHYASANKDTIHQNSIYENLLYVGCTYSLNTPMDIVQSIYNLDPDQIYLRDGNKRTIVHLSCYRSNFRIQNFLLTHNPEAASIQDRYGKIPLHLVLIYHSKDLSLDLIRVLVQIYPEGVLIKDKKGLTPLDYFFQKCRRKLERLRKAYWNDFSMIRQNLSSLRNNISTTHSNDINNSIASQIDHQQYDIHNGQHRFDYEDVQSIKEIFLILLKGVHDSKRKHQYMAKHQHQTNFNSTQIPSNDGNDFIPICAALKVSSIPPVFLFLLLDSLSPTQYKQKDYKGNTILHMVFWQRNSQYGAFEHGLDKLVKKILNEDPRMAQERNQLGELPLGGLLQQGQNMESDWKSYWNQIEMLLAAAPNTIALAVDLLTGLFPFMIAAVPTLSISACKIESHHKRKRENKDITTESSTFILSTIYSLLRLDPSLVKSGIPILNACHNKSATKLVPKQYLYESDNEHGYKCTGSYNRKKARI